MSKEISVIPDVEGYATTDGPVWSRGEYMPVDIGSIDWRPETEPPRSEGGRGVATHMRRQICNRCRIPDCLSNPFDVGETGADFGVIFDRSGKKVFYSSLPDECGFLKTPD